MHEIKTRLLPRNLHQLLEPITIEIAYDWCVTVPKDYVTDFAGIPSGLHFWIRPTDHRIARAALVHDWIYHTHILPRGIADAIFQLLLREDGMPRRKAKIMGAALWLFGKRAYMRGPSKMLARTPALEKYIHSTHKIEHMM